MPLHSLKVGSYGTHHALGLAKCKRARFLLASTSEVYGDPQVHPQPETYWGNVNPIGPRGVYDEAKRYARGADDGVPPPAGRRHRDRPDLQHVRARACARTTGARFRRSCSQALEGKPLTVFGDGSADAQLLLRGRPDPRARPARRVRRASAREPRQPARVHDPRARRDGPPHHGLEERDRATRRCRSTIRRCASPTSRAPRSCSAGSRRSSSRKACGACCRASDGSRSVRKRLGVLAAIVLARCRSARARGAAQERT